MYHVVPGTVKFEEEDSPVKAGEGLEVFARRTDVLAKKLNESRRSRKPSKR